MSRINQLAERLTRLDQADKGGEQSALPPEAFTVGLSRLSEEQVKRLEDYSDEELTHLLFGDNYSEGFPPGFDEINDVLNDGVTEWEKACM